MLFARRVTAVLLKTFKVDAFDWAIQNKPPAGQTIPHLHLNILPRSGGDLPNPEDWFRLVDQQDSQTLESSSRQRLSQRELAEMVAAIHSVAEQERKR